MKMLIDVEQLVLNGGLPNLNHETSRVDLMRELGPHESNHPDIIGYGHVGFDFPGSSQYLRGVTITFPEYFRCGFEAKEQERYIESWLDTRFDWRLGHFTPRTTVEEIRSQIPELKEWRLGDDMFYAFGHGSMLASYRAYMHFRSDSKAGPMIIEFLKVYTRPVKQNEGRTIG